MPRSLFDHVNAVYTNQSIQYFDELDEADKKTFNVYMVNRVVSMAVDFLPIVNQFQLHSETMGARETYLFYSQLLPKKKRFDKYIKASKSETFEPWMLAAVTKYFNVSQAEAKTYCTIFYATEDGRSELRRICEVQAIEESQLKKAKL